MLAFPHTVLFKEMYTGKKTSFVEQDEGMVHLNQHVNFLASQTLLCAIRIDKDDIEP